MMRTVVYMISSALAGLTSGYWIHDYLAPERFDMHSWEAGLVWGLQSPDIARACLADEKSAVCVRGITIYPGETVTTTFEIR